MVLSRRERYVVVVTLAALAVLALDRLAISPLWDRREELKARRDNLAAELTQARELLTQHRKLAPRWREMVGAGMKSDPAEAESQVWHALRDWADRSGVDISLMKPEALTAKGPLPEVAFQASGTGRMASVAQLLWRMQTASIPTKVSEVQINSRKPGTDDLSFQLRVSTLYSPSLSSAGGPATAPAGPAETPGGP